MVRSFPRRVVSLVARQEGRHRIGRPRNDRGEHRLTGDIDFRKNLGARRHSAKPISTGKFPESLLQEIPEKPLSRPIIAPPPGQKVLRQNGCELRRGWAFFFPFLLFRANSPPLIKSRKFANILFSRNQENSYGRLRENLPSPS